MAKNIKRLTLFVLILTMALALTGCDWKFWEKGEDPYVAIESVVSELEDAVIAGSETDFLALLTDELKPSYTTDFVADTSAFSLSGIEVFLASDEKAGVVKALVDQTEIEFEVELDGEDWLISGIGGSYDFNALFQ